MRLVDTLLRGGHLSDGALAEVCLTGERPAHVDRCEICSTRVVEFGRWLDDVRAVGVEEADAAFPPERLAAQEAGILRRLEQLDRPARVIAFPTSSRYDRLPASGAGIRPAWVGIAAAAGLVLGLVGGQVSFRMMEPRTVHVPQAEAVAGPVQTNAYQVPQSLREFDESETVTLGSLSTMDELIPHATQVSLQVGR